MSERTPRPVRRPDFLDEIVRERSERDPEFPGKVKKAYRRRVAERRLRQRRKNQR